MLFFFLVENSIIIAVIIFILSGIKQTKLISEILYGVFYLGPYPILQSLGFIVIKKTRDPLEGVSKLDFMHVVSSTMKQNEKYLTNF